MRMELEIQYLSKTHQWAFFFTFDRRAHLVLAGLSKEYSDFSYVLKKRKMIVRGKLWGIPVTIYSNGVKSQGNASVTNAYIDNNKLFILDRYSTYLMSTAFCWLPNEKKSSLFRQAREVNILVGSQTISLKDLMDLYMRSQSKHAFMTFLDDCLLK